MTYSLNNINEAVDSKFLVTKNIHNQAQQGTLVHIMGGDDSGGNITVNYRVTGSGQDFTIHFNTLKEFCKWARPDTFIARHYENFSTKEIMNYIKISDRTFLTFCLPIIIAALAIIWFVMAVPLKMAKGAVIAGIILSVIAVVAVIIFYKSQKSRVKLKLYQKVSSGWAGGGITFK